MASGTPARVSLRTRLLRHVMIPLALTWLAGTAGALAVAHYFTARAFDRSLLDDAFMLASNVREQDGQLQLQLTQREIDAVLFDQAEAIQFAVYDGLGRLVAGQSGLHALLLDDELSYQFHDLQVGGRTARAVTLRRDAPLPFFVVMTQTTRSRAALLQSVLLYSTVPQLLLLAGLALWLRSAIGRDTEPLAALEQTVNQRDEHDLAPIHVAARTRDVQQLGDSINSLLARLERSLRAQREFAGNVAHELRTPLAGIRALAEYGLKQKDPEAWREQLQRIAASQTRASRTVDQLLALALAEEARVGLALEPVALDELVRDAVLRFLGRADAAGVDLGALDADRSVSVMANITLVEGMLNNLIDNALRYGRPANGVEPAITIALETGAGGEVVLSVSDNGPGLPPDQRAGLLARRAQGDAGQALGEGAGLGLAIVAQYAQLLHARLGLDEAPGGGLRVSVSFRAPAAGLNPA